MNNGTWRGNGWGFGGGDPAPGGAPPRQGEQRAMGCTGWRNEKFKVQSSKFIRRRWRGAEIKRAESDVPAD